MHKNGPKGQMGRGWVPEIPLGDQFDWANKMGN